MNTAPSSRPCRAAHPKWSGLSLLLAGCATAAPMTRSVQPPKEPFNQAVLPTPVAPPAGALRPVRTPATSLAARPAWTGWAPLEAPGAFAPSVADSRALFNAMSDAPTAIGTMEPALVACRLSTTNTTADTFTPPDLRTELRLGGAPTIAESGPDDIPEMFLSRPLIRLAPGDLLDLELWDRDTFSDDFLGSAQATFAGTLPFTWHQGEVFAECRAWGPTETEAAAASRARAFDLLAERVLSLLARAPTAPGPYPDWGRREAGIDAVGEALKELAALVGWDEARVASRDEVLERVANQWDARVRQSVALTAAHARPLSSLPALSPDLHVVSASAACGDATPACVLEIEVFARHVLGLYSAGETLMLQDPAARLPNLSMVSADGTGQKLRVLEVLRAEEEPPVRGEVKAKPGEHLRLIFGIDTFGTRVRPDHPIDSSPVLIGVEAGAHTTLYRAQEPAAKPVDPS